MLLRPLSGKAREVLLEGIDYQELAEEHTTTTPGFRKGDLVKEYCSCIA